MQTDNTLISNREMLAELFATPFRAMAAGLMRMVETNGRTQAIREVVTLSEQELRAKGLNRSEAVTRAFHHDV